PSARVPSRATPPTGRYTLSLHDALPICQRKTALPVGEVNRLSDLIFHQFKTSFKLERNDKVHCFLSITEKNEVDTQLFLQYFFQDRKSTRLNSSHVKISYAVSCLQTQTV